MSSRSREAAISSLIRTFSRALNRSRGNGISTGLNCASRCSMSGATTDQSIGTAPRSTKLEKSAASRVMAAHLTGLAADSILLGYVDPGQWSCRGSVDHVAGRRKSGAVARAVPDLVLVVPPDVAAQMRADAAQCVKLALMIPVEG